MAVLVIIWLADFPKELKQSETKANLSIFM